MTATELPGRVDLSEQGIDASGVVYRNPTTSLLYTQALRRGDGKLAEGGPLVVDTGTFTGRSPKDKFLVDEPSSTDRIWWGDVNQKLSEDHYDGLREKVEHVRDIVENVRDKAEVAFRDRPYLVPVAAGAVGLGIGVLLGSKITRFILFTAVGGILSEALGGEIKRMAGEFMGEFQNRLGEGEGEANASTAE